MTEDDRITREVDQGANDAFAICDVSRPERCPSAAHRGAQPVDSIGHRDTFRRWDLADGRLDQWLDVPQPRQLSGRLAAAQQRAADDRQRTETTEAGGDIGRLTHTDLIETRIGVGVPTR